MRIRQWREHTCNTALVALALCVFALLLRFRELAVAQSASLAWLGSWQFSLVFVGVLLTAVTWVSSRAARQRCQQVLVAGARRVSNLVDLLSTHHLRQALRRDQHDLDLQPLESPLEAVLVRYRQVLTEMVTVQEAVSEQRPSGSRAEAERELSQSFIQQHPSGYASANRLMVARLTPILHWVAATPALQQFLGQSINDLVARSFLAIVHPEDSSLLTRGFQDVLKQGEGHNITFRVRAGDGAEHHLQMDVYARYTDTGIPFQLRCHFLDITAKVTTEQELRRRTVELSQAIDRLRQTNADLERLKESYRDLYHQAPAMYFSLDPRGQVVACNETMARALGHQREDLLGQPYTRLLAEEGRRLFLQDPTAYQRPGELETQWVRKDGSFLEVWIRTTTQVDSAGKFERSRSAALDVTERARLAKAVQAKAEELQQANEQLRRINQELEEFTYVVSHDLKEPLRTVQTFSTFLAQDYGHQLGAEGQEQINYLIQASKRLGLLIDDLLTLSRAGRVIHALRTFDLEEALQTVRGDLADLIQRKAALVRVAGPLPFIAGDRERVIQLLANLITNGLKYNHASRPEVVVGALPFDETNGSPEDHPDSFNGPMVSPDYRRATADSRPAFVTLYVRDNGIGIEPRYHEQIFGIFRRLHHRDEYEGTGAGLAICKKIVEAHGGRIWLESAPGRGSTFYFLLPLAQEQLVLGSSPNPELALREQGP
jgi:PAS domain S-box-containing protein